MSLARRRVDHVAVVGADLLVQALGGMGEQVAVLVNCAPLHRHAIPDGGNRLVEPRCAVDDEELGPSQTALDEIVEDSAPGFGAFSAHAFDCEQHLLAVRAHAEDNEQRDRGRLAVEPHAHHRAVENKPHDRLLDQRAGIPGFPVGLHLALHPTHRVLAHRAAKQRRERPAYPPCIGAGEIRACDQRVGGKRTPLVSPQRLALPLRRLAVGSVQPGARHGDLDRAERAGQRPRPAPVAVAGNVRTF